MTAMFSKLAKWFARAAPAPSPGDSRDAWLASLRPGWDVTDPVAWDQFWEQRFDEAEGLPFELTHYEEIIRPLIPRIRAEQLSRVLDVGCGVHLEVKAFAEIGLESVGLDLSSVAIRRAEGCQELERLRDHFFDESDRRPGGSWRYVRGDIFDASVCPGPFDIVVSRSMVQYFYHLNRMGEALDAMTSRLTPTGILVITSHGAPHTFKPLALEIEARGFRIVNPYLEGESYSPKGGERIAVYGKSTG